MVIDVDALLAAAGAATVPRSIVVPPPPPDFPELFLGAFCFRQHPPTSWGLIEHSLERITVLFASGGPLPLARILAHAKTKLTCAGDGFLVEKIRAGTYNWHDDGLLIFYPSKLHAYERLLLDSALREAALVQFGMQCRLEVPDSGIDLYGNAGVVSVLREFPVFSCR